MKMILSNAKNAAEVKGKEVVPVVLTDKKEVEVFREDGRKTISFGIGPKKEITRRKLITISRRIIALAKQHKAKRIALTFSDFTFPRLKSVPPEELALLLAREFELANFEFTKFKAKPKEGWNEIAEIIICAGGVRQRADSSALAAHVKKGQTIGQEINKCRIVSNTPGGDMTPTLLANEAKKAARGAKVRVKILGKKEMEKLKMDAVLGVAKGSKEEPKFIIMEYRGFTQNKRGTNAEQTQKSGDTSMDEAAPIVLVGKGVTFDTGGLNLKPSDGILDMHLDMSGGAAVIHAVILAAKLRLRKNVVGLIPAVENMPSGESYRPGDILRSMSGKTIEVLNTDAEGRIILADALTYAKRYNPRLVVDVATLTGASLIALGTHASAIMTKDKKLETLMQKLGEETGDYVWPFPLWDEYEEGVKGNFADVANIPASGNSRHAGVILGGMFLWQFAKELKAPWAHIDMAPRMVSANGDHLAKGAAGSPVRLLVKLLEEY